jgi:hypothetical protein
MLVGPNGSSEHGCYGYLEEVRAVAVAGVPVPSQGGLATVPEDIVVSATEIWALEPLGTADSTG